MQTASLCRMVLVRTDPIGNNGATVCPAIITRVWGVTEHDGHQWTVVNLALFHDGNGHVSALTSAQLFADEAAAEAWAATQDEPDAAGHGLAYWPPRTD